MNAGKSTLLLQAAHNYAERGMRTMLLTAAIDDRAGKGMIASRIGIDKPAGTFTPADDLFQRVEAEHEREPIACVLVDEAQFLTERQVWQLARVVDGLGIPDAEDVPRARIVLRRADGSLIKKPEELRPTPTASLNTPHGEGEEHSDAVSPETSDRPPKQDEPSDAAVLSGETQEADAQHPLPSDDGVSAAPLLKPVPSPTQTQAVPRAAASMAPGSAVALDLSHLAGCTLTGSVQWWAPNLPSWLKLDADEGIAHGRVPSDHAPDLIAVSVVCANDLGATATLCVTVRIEA